MEHKKGAGSAPPRKFLARHIGAAAILALALYSCGSPSPKASAAKSDLRAAELSASDPWRAVRLSFAGRPPALLLNPSLGIRIGEQGEFVRGTVLTSDAFAAANGAAFQADRIPGGQLLLDGRPLGDLQAWKQTMDFSTGLLQTEFRARGMSFVIRNAIDPRERVIGQCIRAIGARSKPSFVVPVGTVDAKALKNANPIQVDGLAASGRPIRNRLESQGGIARWSGSDVILESSAGAEGSHFDRVVAISDSSIQLYRGGFYKTEGARGGAMPPVSSFEELRRRSAAYWQPSARADIVIEGPADDQRAVRSMLFYLRAALGGKAKGRGAPPTPFGLSSNRYGARAFWDADIWMLPAVALLEPEAARTIVRFRQATADAARSNFERWAAGQAQAPREAGRASGLRFPWEANLDGAELAPDEFQREIHVSGSVAFGVKLAEAFGYAPPSYSNAVVRGVSQFYRLRARQEEDGKLHLDGVLSPDEFHKGNDDLYTNLLAQWSLNAGSWKRPPGGPEMFLPRDGKSLLTYENDRLRSYKQAAALLAIYPLQFPPAERSARQMLDRFAGRTTPNGPAMSLPIEAIAWARLGETQKGYETWRESWQRYTAGGLMLFSEKPRSGETYFLTGAGGSFQAMLFGLLGIRIDEVTDPRASMTMQLRAGRWLSVTPHLPRSWKSVRIKNMTLLGKKLSLTITAAQATVTKGEP